MLKYENLGSMPPEVVNEGAAAHDESHVMPKLECRLAEGMCDDASEPNQSLRTIRSMEARSRWTSMVAELNYLRDRLRMKESLEKLQSADMTDQLANRARNALVTVDRKIKMAASAYREHRGVFLAITGGGEWEMRMRELQDVDCRSLGITYESSPSMEMQHDVSWVWKGQSAEMWTVQ